MHTQTPCWASFLLPMVCKLGCGNTVPHPLFCYSGVVGDQGMLRLVNWRVHLAACSLRHIRSQRLNWEKGSAESRFLWHECAKLGGCLPIAFALKDTSGLCHEEKWGKLGLWRRNRCQGKPRWPAQREECKHAFFIDKIQSSMWTCFGAVRKNRKQSPDDDRSYCSFDSPT